MRIAEVVYPKPLDTFDYEIPEELAGTLRPGMRVRAPFGPQSSAAGIVLALREGTADFHLKPISSVPDQSPLLSEEHIALANWLASKYCAPLGECLKLMVPSNVREARRPILLPERPAPPPLAEPSSPPKFELTAGQKDALASLRSCLSKRRFAAALLFGVPASGKTEVYTRLIREAVRDGGQALFLVPEISLTTPFFDDFRKSLGLPVALWHSKVKHGDRRKFWTGLRTGELRVVVGARSASLLPFKDLRLAVMDEEQDESYKQDEQAPFYHARDVVLRRAEAFGATAVLGSATPSIEAFSLATAGRIELVRMDQRVSKTTSRPPIRILTRKEQGPGPCLDPELVEAIQARLERKEQVILIVNRRGFSNFIICRTCGWVARCPECSVAMIHHRRPAAAAGPGLFDALSPFYLRCHHCGLSDDEPDKCGRCSKGPLRQAGIGTQKVEQDLKNRIPGARVLRMDGDTVAGEDRSENPLYRAFLSGKADILVGTKLAAKGFHFPRVTLVGIVDADTMLSMPDFRAAERTVQLLVQAAGRAGRAERPGEVLLQTAQPTHYAIQAAARGDYASFSEEEIRMRQDLRYPPAAALIRLLFTGKTEKTVARGAAAAGKQLREILEDGGRTEVIGPAPGVLPKAHGNFRWHLLIKTGDPDASKPLSAVRELKLPSSVRVKVNVDPYDFF